MTPAEYLIEVARTMSPHCTKTTLGLGLLGEAGEVCDLVKKAFERDQPMDPDKLIHELGDVLWYVAARSLDRAYDTKDPDPDFAALVRAGSVASAQRRALSLADLVVDLAGTAYCTVYARADPYDDLVIGRIVALCERISPPATLEEVMAANVAKLRVRYPDGFAV
jgi:MazG nucleotide pyrophosphohydrolase domain